MTVWTRRAFLRAGAVAAAGGTIVLTFDSSRNRLLSAVGLARGDEVAPSTLTATRLAPPDAPFVGALFMPPGDGPRAGVLIVGGSEGGSVGPETQASAFAHAGVPALAVAYFGAPGLPADLRDIPLEYFAGALRWFGEQPSVDESRMVMAGGSRGSEAALLTAVHFPELVRGVIGFVPGNVALRAPRASVPVWTLKGEPLPYATAFGPEADDPRALIEVERINGPVVLVAGGADQVWPSSAMAKAIAERLEARGHRFGVTVMDYPAAGHRVGLVVPRASSVGSVDEVDVRAREDAWPKVLEFVMSVPSR